MGLHLTILIALLLSAFFSGMEIAFVSSNKLRHEVERDETSLTWAIISKFYANPQQFITTMLVGNNVVLVVFSIKIRQVLQPLLTFTNNDLLLSFIVSLIATVIVLFIGEYIPKMLMRQNPNRWLQAFSPLLYLIYILLYPAAWFCVWISESVLKLLGVKHINSDKQMSFSRADLNYLIEEIEQQNDNDNKEQEEAPSENELQILRNALDFSNVKVRDCYIPRTEVVALPYEASIDDLLHTFQETGFSKIPIYKNDIDNIVGYIHCSEMFNHQRTWHEHINKMQFVPENMAAQKLMQTFMKQRKSMAVVVDEFGGTAGIITLEDIFEEIFGEIEDEHDTQEFTAKRTAENEITASGRIEVEELNERFGLDLPEDESYDTLAGLILNQTGSFPKVNGVTQIGKYKFKCVKMADNRIEIVKIMF